MTPDYVLMGARAILRRALAEQDIYVGPRAETADLVRWTRVFDAPVEKIADWWDIIGQGRPKLSVRQREIMFASARRALELFRQEQKA